MRKSALAAVGAAALGAATLTISTAQADLVTRCIGEAGEVTVPGDLVVPRGESCMLTGTTIQGDVRVAPGANLIVEDGTLNGAVSVANGGYFDTTNTSIGDRVVLRPDGYGVFLDTSQVSGHLIAQAANDVPGFVYALDSTVDGSVRTDRTDTFVDASQVTGSVTTDQTPLTDIYDSFIDGHLIVSGTTPDGSAVCGSVIQGATTYTDNTAPLQIGADGVAYACDSTSYFGADVRISGTNGSARVDQAIINGDLVLDANDPVAQVGSNLMIRGEIIGDHEAAAAEPQTRRQASTDRGDARDRAEQRHKDAVAEAAAAGDAQL